MSVEEARHEVEMLKSMNHANVVRLYEFFESDTTVYIIMEELERNLKSEYDHEEIKLIMHV